VIVSVVLHAAVIYSASRMQWSEATLPERRAARVVWLKEWPVEPPTEPVEIPEPVAPHTPLEPEEQSPLPERAPPAPADAVDEREADEGAAPSEPAAGDRPRRVYLAPGIDWDKERELAVARVLEEIEREQNYVTFSNEELFEQAPEAEPDPREHLFDRPSRGPRRSVLSPGQARTAFGRRLGELCNALDLFSACADAGPTADFFADIRPDALNSLPECAEPDDLPALAIERRDVFPTIKCRLVLKDEDER
jgi:hypothetical protein